MLSDLSGGDQVLGTRSSRGDHAVEFSQYILTPWGSLSSRSMHQNVKNWYWLVLSGQVLFFGDYRLRIQFRKRKQINLCSFSVGSRFVPALHQSFFFPSPLLPRRHSWRHLFSEKSGGSWKRGVGVEDYDASSTTSKNGSPTIRRSLCFYM